jgi:hypothetical protein
MSKRRFVYSKARSKDNYITGKLSTLNNYLINCGFCPDEVKKRAHEWRHNSDEDHVEDVESVDHSMTTTSSTRHLSGESTVPIDVDATD